MSEQNSVMLQGQVERVIFFRAGETSRKYWAVLRFSLFCTSVDEAGGLRRNWLTCELRGDDAFDLRSILSGSKVLLTGQLRSVKYEHRGITHYEMYVAVDEIVLDK